MSCYTSPVALARLTGLTKRLPAPLVPLLLLREQEPVAGVGKPPCVVPFAKEVSLRPARHPYLLGALPRSSSN